MWRLTDLSENFLHSGSLKASLGVGACFHFLHRQKICSLTEQWERSLLVSIQQDLEVSSFTDILYLIQSVLPMWLACFYVYMCVIHHFQCITSIFCIIMMLFYISQKGLDILIQVEEMSQLWRQWHGHSTGWVILDMGYVCENVYDMISDKQRRSPSRQAHSWSSIVELSVFASFSLLSKYSCTPSPYFFVQLC